MLKEGMYVRCSVDEDFPEDPREFALGKVITVHLSSHEVTVAFYDRSKEKVMSVYGVPAVRNYSIDEVVHVGIQLSTEVRIKTLSMDGFIIEKSDDMEEGYFQYYIKTNSRGNSNITLVNEKDLRVTFSHSNINPIEQMKEFEFHNPIWYNHRQIVSKSIHILKNATYGFDTLIGSRVFLLPHQVDTIIRAVVENPCRLMLADEVGLGKTIQAAVIKKGLQNRLGRLKTLIIVPESLVFQWKNEFSYKFWEDIAIWSEGQSCEVSQLIFPLEKLNTEDGQLLLEKDWDICIIDETHRLLKLEKEYDMILKFSESVTHILLLTATPIQSRRSEYIKLLSLLEPQKYAHMGVDKFENLLEKQAYLSGKIHSLVRDLPEYHEDELAEDYFDELEEIANRLNDSLLNNLVKEIDIHSNHDEGLAAVRLVIAYIGEHYQIDRRVIRHRRKELSKSLAQRSLQVISYPMRGAEVSFYESETYEKTLEYLEIFCESDNTKDDLSELNQIWLSAMFSSPWALKSLVEIRKQIIKSSQYHEKDNVGTELQLIKPFLQEIELLNEMFDLSIRWESGVLDEIRRSDELYDDPDLIKGRFMKIVDYLNQSIDEKYVIFSSWTETVTALKEVMVNQFGKNVVRTFHKGMTKEELQIAADDFQSNQDCRIIICDELGGEGRNFQIADEVIHVDLPWSPTTLEQRIGRLDRIGREKKVHSVIFITEGTLEEELFDLWNRGLEIFNESLSGLEIAIGDIHEQIGYALVNNLRYGLGEVLNLMSESLQTMRKKVEEERYFDMARQLDKQVEEQLLKLIDQFDGEDGKELQGTMMSWADLTGLNGYSEENKKIIIFKKGRASINSMKKTMLIPPDLNEAHRRSNRDMEISGTFLRNYAIQREDLLFYAPGDPFFDAIVNNSYGCELGRTTAFRQNNAEVNWRGFVFTWNVSIDATPLIRKGYPVENIALAHGYIPLEPFMTFEGLTETDIIDPLILIIEMQKHWDSKDIEHLGKRTNGKVDIFKANFEKQDWINRVEDAYQQSINKVTEELNQRINLTRVKNDFQSRIDGIRAANLYYNRVENKDIMAVERWEEIFNALEHGLRKPKISLDSAAFVWMVKRNG